MKKTTLIITIIFSCLLLTSCKDTKKTYYDTGKLMCEYIQKNGIEHGPFKCYYESGALRIEGTYKNGKQEGITKVYYESGALWIEGTFKNDKYEGIAKMYDEYGALWIAIKYQNDKAVRGICGNGRELTYTEIENWNNGLDVNCNY